MTTTTNDEYSRTSNCEQCGTPTSFERTDPKTQPREGEVCERCGMWVCVDCAHETGKPCPPYQQPTQLAPDSGEWHVEAMPIHGWRVVDMTGEEIVADVYREEDARQIVAEHNATPKLVEALQRRVSPTKCYCEVMLETKCGECADRKLLASLATTTQPDAEEGQG